MTLRNMTTADHPKEVTMIWNYPNWGGAQIYFMSIVRNAPSDWKIRLVLPHDAGTEITKLFEPFGVEIQRLNFVYEAHETNSLGESLKRQWKRIRSEIEMYRYARANVTPGSIVHIEAGPWQSWILLYLLSLRFKVVTTMHNSLPPAGGHSSRTSIWSTRMNFLMRSPNYQAFAANQDAVNSLRSYIDKRFWNKISLTRAAINPIEIGDVMAGPFDRKELLRRHGVPTDRFIVLCVGQFIDRKGRWIFLEAAVRAKAEGNDMMFVWIGPWPLSEADIARIGGYDVEGYFKYILSPSLGSERKDVLTFFRVADVFVLASYAEGLPISIIEAQALGIPVISTNIKAIPEAIKDGETGKLIEPGDANALLSAIHRYSDDVEFRDRIGQAAREFALETFDERATAATVFARYQTALDGEL